MARPREFDESKVIDAAMLHFWEHGYERASLEGLQQCTGLSKSSLYAAFEDKHELFLLCLKHYVEVQQRHLVAGLAEKASLEIRLRKLLEAVVSDSTAEASRGCLMVKSMVDLAAHDESVASMAAANALFFQRTVSEHIVAAQQKSEVSAQLVPHEYASFLFGSISGLRVMGRAGVGRRQLKQHINFILQPLQPL